MNETKKQFNFHIVNKKIIGIALFLTLVFFVSQIYVMSHVGTKSSEVEILRQQDDEARRQNDILTAQINKEKSISSIQSVVNKMGLVEKQVQELNDPLNNNVALSN